MLHHPQGLKVRQIMLLRPQAVTYLAKHCKDGDLKSIYMTVDNAREVVEVHGLVKAPLPGMNNNASSSCKALWKQLTSGLDIQSQNQRVPTSITNVADFVQWLWAGTLIMPNDNWIGHPSDANPTSYTTEQATTALLTMCMAQVVGLISEVSSHQYYEIMGIPSSYECKLAEKVTVE